MIRVLIADSQILTSEGITSILSGIADIQIVGRLINKADLEPLIISTKPDVVIADHLNTAGINKINKQFDFARILVLSNKQQKNEILEVVNLGIKNYISKE